MGSVIEARGYNGQVEFDGTAVTLKREGAKARLSHGKGEKFIPLGQLSGVHFKPAGFISNGFIQFSLAGELAGRSLKGGRTFNAAADENSVIFTKKQESDFADLKKRITAALSGS